MSKIASDEQVKHWAKQLMHNGKATYGELERKNAELERKLAEQQTLFIIMAHGTDRDELLRISGHEELDNLLAVERGVGRKEIEELQRQVAMLVDALKEHIEYTDHSTGSGRGRELHNKAAVAYFATAAQSAAWLEASHIEWMKGLEPVGIFMNHDGNFEKIADECIGMPNLGETIPLYAIPTKKD